MANYNTFVVVNCSTRKPIVTTSSARKAYKELQTGIRVEVWSNNVLIERIYLWYVSPPCDDKTNSYKANRKWSV